MINVRNSLRGGGDKVEINMGPLIDMVFLLLIFFVVTTSFVKESGIDVQKSVQRNAGTKLCIQWKALKTQIKSNVVMWGC